MNNGAQRFTPLLLLFAGVLLTGGIRQQYKVPPARPMSALPVTFLNTTSKNVVIADEEQKVAGMSDYMLREYYGSSREMRFSIYVGYYAQQVQGKSIHSPKNCLPGAGWEIISSEASVLRNSGVNGARINKVVLANRGVRAVVYYWYQGRGRVESNEFKVKWNLLRDAAALGRTEEALVRIVVPVNAGAKPSDVSSNTMNAQLIADSLVVPVLQSVKSVLPEA